MATLRLEIQGNPQQWIWQTQQLFHVAKRPPKIETAYNLHEVSCPAAVGFTVQGAQGARCNGVDGEVGGCPARKNARETLVMIGSKMNTLNISVVRAKRQRVMYFNRRTDWIALLNV